MSKKIILLSRLHQLVDKGEFSISFVKKDGSIVKANRAVCTSWHSSGRNMTIKFIESGEIRSIRRCTIIEFNGMEVCL